MLAFLGDGEILFTWVNADGCNSPEVMALEDFELLFD